MKLNKIYLVTGILLSSLNIFSAEINSKLTIIVKYYDLKSKAGNGGYSICKLDISNKKYIPNISELKKFIETKFNLEPYKYYLLKESVYNELIQNIKRISQINDSDNFNSVSESDFENGKLNLIAFVTDEIQD